MYLRVTRQKRKDGTFLSHFQIAHNSWDPVRKRSRVHILHNVGRADDPKASDALRRLAGSILQRCDPQQVADLHRDWRFVRAWPFGDLFVLDALWQRLGMPQVIARARAGQPRLAFDVERALFALVANRACAPASKRHSCLQWLAEDVRLPGLPQFQLQHLYRAMDFLEAHREAIEEEIFRRTARLLEADTELLFLDITSLHCGIDGQHEEERQADVGRGHAKNGRGDVPQLVIGLAVTRDGLPVRHWVWPGNTVDAETVQQARRDLRGWHLKRCVFVGDAGMVSRANVRAQAAAGGRYLVGQSLRQGGEACEQALGRPGRYRQVAENLRVQEVTVGQGEWRRRYAVCHNLQEAARQKRHREQVLEELEAELASLARARSKGQARKKAGRGKAAGGGHRKRECELHASGRYGRYLRVDRGGRLAIDRGKVRAAERRDGKFVVHGNDDSLSGEDMALGYKQLQRVEQAWRSLKSGLGLRSLHHWTPHQIEAHVSIAVLALLLERVAERASGQTWRTMRDQLKHIQLAQLLQGKRKAWQVTAPDEEARKLLNKLEIDQPPPILDME